jgi:hypothetical protein
MIDEILVKRFRIFGIIWASLCQTRTFVVRLLCILGKSADSIHSNLCCVFRQFLLNVLSSVDVVHFLDDYNTIRLKSNVAYASININWLGDWDCIVVVFSESLE